MAIDYGLRRAGISVTDPLRIIVQGLETQKTEHLPEFIRKYTSNEMIDEIIVGYPFYDGAFGDPKFKKSLDAFIEDLRKTYPAIEIKLFDERFSSMKAREIILQSGAKRKKRQSKEHLDKTSAIVILQEYLGHI